MTHNSYRKEGPVLPFIDHSDDFLSQGSKLWPLGENVAREVGLLDNQRSIISSIRKGRFGEEAGFCERHMGRQLASRFCATIGRHHHQRALGPDLTFQTQAARTINNNERQAENVNEASRCTAIQHNFF